MAEIKKAKNLADWFDQRLHVKGFIKVMMTEYWIPKRINFLWAMGVILLTMFAILFITGLLLVMYYKPDTMLAFDSVNKTIMQEVEYGWLWRHMHGVAASVVFLIMYIHLFTGIYYGSYKRGREMIWISGMVLFVLFSAEAFSGYMLPWGQMSYWAAMVITNLFGGIPFIGPELVEWIRGDYAVGDATLTRFFMLHVCLLPIVVIAFIAFHFYSLRFPHVNNEIAEELDFDLEAEKYLAGNKKEAKVVSFWPDFLCKDIFYISLFMILYFYLVCFHFDFAMDPINFEPANPLKTPPHIYPEWYFLWSYEILRGFSYEVGLACFGIAQVIFFILPFLDRSSKVAPIHARGPLFIVWFWLLLIDMIVLTIYGKLPPVGINNTIATIASVVFLALLIVVLPVISMIERKASK